MASNKRTSRKSAEIDSDEEIEEVSKKAKLDTNGANGDAEDNGTPIKLEGSMQSGELLFSGGSNWDLVGRSKVPASMKNRGGRNLWSPHRIGSLIGVKIRTVASHCAAAHNLAIDTEGRVYSWGRNESGQLGHGDTNRRDTPTIIDALEGMNIVEAACGKNHSLVITETGHVYTWGENAKGQLGVGSQGDPKLSPMKIAYSGPGIRKAACGAEFSMIVSVNGNLYSFGLPEYGQLGHNTDGKFIAKARKIEYSCETKPRQVMVFIEKKQGSKQVDAVRDVEIQDVACGVNHTVCMDRKKRVFTWGFGGYGRLGHGGPADEMVPRLVAAMVGPMRGAEQISAGSSFCLAFTEAGNLMMWGQNKPSGEAAMYPKPIQDLCGWKVRSIGCCHKSIIVAADESLISWGSSPTFGELGYGENKPKSSTTPQEVKSMNGSHVTAVAGGHGHVCIIVRNETDEDQELISKLPKFVPMGECK